MTLDEVCAMTLDQICDGGPYPDAAIVKDGEPTGLPGVNGTYVVHASTLFSACGASAADLREGKTVDDVTGTLLDLLRLQTS
jgi:hypothetical protein